MFRSTRLLVLVVLAALTSTLVPGFARAADARNGLIAFSRDGDVFTIRPNGTGLNRLTKGDAIDTPLWSPDGSKLVVVRVRYNEPGVARWTIVTMRPNGSDRARLRPRVLGSIQEPEVSPDGTKLAFADTDLFNPGIPAPYASAIRVVDLRTGVSTRLTDYGTWNGGPVWSPDGDKIAFGSSRDGDSEIFVMASDGSGPAQITNNELDDYSPDWSPDGSLIAFSTSMTEDGSDVGAGISLVPAAGGAVISITRERRYDAQPSWSPDGSRILFSSFSETTGTKVWVMNKAGGEAFSFDADLAVWAPDGTRIAFVRRGDLFVAAPDGTDKERRTRGGAFDNIPVWQSN